MLTRRRFIQASAAAGAAALMPRTLFSQTKPARRPNFIFIVTDDQRFDAMGVVQRELGDAARFPWFQTPAMDRIANEGARFRNAFVVHSLCSPSRASFLTGLHSHQHGVKHNSLPLGDFPNWASELAKVGYATGYFGKFHMDRQPDRPGFQHVFSYIGQGVYENCPFMENGKKVETTGWVDDVCTDHALDYIRANKEKPFALVVGFKSPHDPRTPAPRRANDYADKEIAPPVNLKALPPWRHASQEKPVPTYNGHNNDHLNYFRCISCVDDNVGRILEALDQLGLADDTCIVFAGDNGYYLREHGLGDKRSAYEESVRIPFILRYPRLVKPGTLIDAMTLNIDLAPTLLALAGVAAPPSMAGRSLAPLLTGVKPVDWRTSFLYQNYVDPAYPKVTFDVLAVRTEDAKLVTYPGHDDWTQLFDLTKDPHEMNNLANDPAAADLLKRMQQKLEKQRRETGFDKQ